MPYKHSGEIGDVWKHLPLCDVLEIESPKRYFETNSAFAEYRLVKSPLNEYGIYHVFQDASGTIGESRYLKILNSIDFRGTNTYFGSPALAMTVLEQIGSHFYFHDIEKEPLEDILRFALERKIQDSVTISRGNSISAFLHGGYCFDRNDFVFIDPYQPLDCNEVGETFFDVFEKALKCQAKTMLWYGYDTLKDQKKIIDKLHVLSAFVPGNSVHTFDVWQDCMEQEVCVINPGVPGCGIATANLKTESISSMEGYLKQIEDVYRDVKFEDETTTLRISHLVL